MLDSLHRRPRGRAWAEALAVLTNGRVPGPPSPARSGEPLADDRIVGALMANRAPAHVELADGDRALDSGCSSGRRLRVLRAWRPDVHWMGCDPNEGAIGWAVRTSRDRLLRQSVGPAAHA